MLRAVTRVPMAGASHEAEYAKRNQRAVALLVSAKSATPAIRAHIHQRVMLEYLGLADAIANRFRSAHLEETDLHQIAYLGLAKAVQRFDPSSGGEIAAFAVPTISGEIKRHLRDTSWLVRPPRAIQEAIAELSVELPKLTQELGATPDVRELADATGLKPDVVEEALVCRGLRSPVSLDAALGSDDAHELTLADLLADDDSNFERAELSLLLEDALGTLTPSERELVRMRFDEERTQLEIAQELGISQMQVSRLLSRVLGALRAHLTAALASIE